MTASVLRSRAGGARCAEIELGSSARMQLVAIVLVKIAGCIGLRFKLLLDCGTFVRFVA